MCWSAEVSFGFGLAHWLGLVYLLRRKQKHDAWYVVALVPLAIQETMQFFGWLLINRERNDAFTCSSLNKATAGGIIVSVGFVPVAFCLFARYLNVDKKSWRARVITATTALAFCSYIFNAFTQLLFVVTTTKDTICNNIHGADDPTPGSCTQCLHEGPNGHQVWPLKVIPFMYGYLSLLLLPYNWLPTIAMGLTIPRWPATPIIICYWLLYLPNRILLSRDFEWLSVWCWTGFLLQVIAVADPFVRKYLHAVSERKHLAQEMAKSVRLVKSE